MSHHFLRTTTVALLILCAFCLLGCVGFLRETADYTKVRVDLPTKAAVLEHFGEPVRKATEGNLDVWYYMLKQKGIAGQSVQESKTAVMLVVFPLWHTTQYEDNAKFLFSGEKLVEAYERVSSGSGFICGIVVAHGISPICTGGSEKGKLKQEPSTATSPAKTTIPVQIPSDVSLPLPPRANASRATLDSEVNVSPIFLVPLDDFGSDYAVKLARMLKIELGLDIHATPNMDVSDLQPFPDTEQFASERIIAKLSEFRLNIPERQANSVVIGLTHRDMNTETRKPNFLFAQHNNAGRTSIISTARMRFTDYKVQGLSDFEALRLYKIVKRTIGELHYSFPRTNNPNDVMYGRTGSMQDVDIMGTEYGGVLEHKNQIPSNALNCNIDNPPPESGEEWDHGTQIRIFPRQQTLPPNYTGCQTKWVGIDGGKWFANSKTYFQNGAFAVWWRVAEGKHPSGVYCYFENNALIAGPPRLCYVPAAALHPSMSPGCLADATRSGAISDKCLHSYEPILLLEKQ